MIIIGSSRKTMVVGANLVVSLRFTLKNKGGGVLEDIMAKDPVEYLHGSGNILPALEAGIEGMQKGETKSVVFKNDASQSGEEYFIDVVIDHIREATAKELQQGKPEPRQPDCGPECCC